MSNSPGLTPSQLNYAQTAQWKEFLRQALADVRVAIPSIVKSFDAGTQTVSVQIAVSELVRLNNPQWTAIQPINKVPIILPRAGGFCLTLPIQAGDEGMLVFCDSCIDLWWLNGGIQPPAGAPFTQPEFERRRHDLNDCGFYPGTWNQTRVLPAYSIFSAQLRTDDGTCYLELAPGGIVNILAPGGVNIIGNLNATEEITAQTLTIPIPLSTHLHSDVTGGLDDTGPPIP